MSDSHDQQSLIRTPKQLIVAVTAFFLVIVLGIILLVTFVTNSPLTGAGTNGLNAEAVTDRLRPVAEQGFNLIDANAPRVLQAGGAVYASVCAACHDNGLAGAPKTGDSSGWGARLSQGYDTLLKHAIEGIRAMPAKGGNPDLTDVEVARALVFMTNKSGASFKEPDAPSETATGDAVAAPVPKAPSTN